MYNFKNCLDNILGNNPLTKLGNDNGEKVVSELKQKIKDYNWRLESLTTDKIRHLLNISNRKYLCKFSTLLLHILKGKPLIPLSREQRDRIEFIYFQVRQYLPKRMNNTFVVYKILEIVLPEWPQRELLSYIKLQSADTIQKNERLWNSAARAAGMYDADDMMRG